MLITTQICVASFINIYYTENERQGNVMEFENYSKNIVTDFFAQKKDKVVNLKLVIVIAIMLVSIVCVFALAGVPDPEPEIMTLDTQRGDYCKITVADIELAATSDTTGYYYILDNEGYLGLICTSPIDLTGELLDVYNDATGTVTATVTGLAADIPEELVGFAIEDFELAGVSDFHDYFGYYLLDINRTYTNTWFEVALFCAFIFTIIAVIMILAALIRRAKKKNAIRKLEASGELDRVAREMRSPDTLTLEDGSSKIVLTPSYLVANDGYVIRLSDILWCFKQVRKINGFSVGSGLTLACKHKKSYFIFSASPNQSHENAILAVVNALKERLPDMMIGYTGDNRRVYKQKLKEVID